MLYNDHFDFIIQSNPTLKKMADNGTLLAFADEMLIIAKEKEEAEETLKADEEI